WTTTWSAFSKARRRRNELRWFSKQIGRCGGCWRRTSASVIRNGTNPRSPPRLPGGCSVNQIDFLNIVVGILEGQGVAYMVVGSFVSSRFGEARFTNDVDIVIDVNEAQVLSLCEAFPADSFYVSRQAAIEAVRTRRQFNVIHSASG